MANDGRLELTPEEARNDALQMKKLADEMNELLEGVSNSMEDINSEETGIYQGNNRPAQLRAELDNFRKEFYKVYEQIVTSADHILEVVTVSENE